VAAVFIGRLRRWWLVPAFSIGGARGGWGRERRCVAWLW